MASFVWYEKAVIDSTRAEVEGRMRKVAQVVRDQTVRFLNRSQPTRTTPSGRRIGLSPSLPGEPPKRLESQLIQNINWEVVSEPRAVISRIGTNQKKARRLELGFVGTDSAGRNISQAPRPFLRRALAEMRAAIVNLLGGR